MRAAYNRVAQHIAAQKYMVLIDDKDPFGFNPERVAVEPNGKARLLLYWLVGLAAVRRLEGDTWEVVATARAADHEYAMKLAAQLAHNNVPKLVELVKQAQAEDDAFVDREWQVIEAAAKNLAETTARRRVTA